jgi:phage tail tape-measure protein
MGDPMKNVSFLILSFVLVSCSTYKKTITYSSISGAVAGGMAGAALSPDSYSRPHNAVIFGAVGALTAGFLGHFLYNEDPRNRKFDELKLDDEEKLKWEKKSNEELNVGPVNITFNF